MDDKEKIALGLGLAAAAGLGIYMVSKAKAQAQTQSQTASSTNGTLLVFVALNEGGQLPVLVQGATVTVDGSSCRTDVRGMCQFTLSPGTYTVTASYPGYKSSSMAVSIRPGERLAVQLTLEPSSSTGGGGGGTQPLSVSISVEAVS